MIPGKSLILKCPHCGGEKEVVSLVSGNTCGATLWSDQRFFAPMLPKVSAVQRCPHCGHYFFSYKQECNKHSNGFTLKTGYVNYSHMKKAMDELLKNDLEKVDEFNLRLLMAQSYNDWFYRFDKDNGIPEEDEVKFFNDNIMKLISGFPQRMKDGEFLKSDLLREAGEFEDALHTLPQKTDFNQDYHILIDKEILAIKEHRTCPFIVWGEYQKISLEMDYYDIHIGDIAHQEDPRRIHEILEKLIRDSHSKNE